MFAVGANHYSQLHHLPYHAYESSAVRVTITEPYSRWHSTLPPAYAASSRLLALRR